MYLTTQEELISLTEKLKDCNVLAIDTEFVREKTYFHRLGLIQVAGEGVCAAVDPIKIKDLNPLLEVFKQKDKIKVFHAGKQDIEILYRLCGKVVSPIFDTQVAASLLGWGTQISFAKIVYKAIGKKIGKSETYSDWCHRPLRQSQIDYALNDVLYLLPVYWRLLEKLNELDRVDWVYEELRPLEDEKNYQLPDPHKQFMRIKNYRTLKPKNLAVLREIAAWREEEAKKRNCLAKAVVRDEPLLEMARNLPDSLEKLSTIRGLHPKEAASKGEKIINAIQKGLNVPKSDYPVIPESNNYSTSRGVEELIAAYVQIRSEELKIEPNVLADRKTIHSFVRGHEQEDDLEDHPLFRGWKRDLIGDDLHHILQGKLGLVINKHGKVSLVPSEIKNPE